MAPSKTERISIRCHRWKSIQWIHRIIFFPFLSNGRRCRVRLQRKKKRQREMQQKKFLIKKPSILMWAASLSTGWCWYLYKAIYRIDRLFLFVGSGYRPATAHPFQSALTNRKEKKATKKKKIRITWSQDVCTLCALPPKVYCKSKGCGIYEFITCRFR